MTIVDSRPIILTASMDAGAQSYFDERRERYFPAERNWLSAHLTLFHALPGECHEQIAALLDNEVAMSPTILASVAGIRNLGGGVAYVIRSDGLSAFRRKLAQEWSDWLTPQDRQAFSPHVTVQNKATRAEARLTADILAAEFSPFDVVIGGITVWRYDGGPWECEAEHAFRVSVARLGGGSGEAS